MSQEPDPRRFVVIGDPALNRVALFREAALAAGCDVEVAPYVDVLSNVDAWVTRVSGRTIRLESPGRDPSTERTILARGAYVMGAGENHLSRWPESAIPTLDRGPGLIFGPRQWYHGWQDAIFTIGRIANAAGASFLNAPADVAEMFDKVSCHRRTALLFPQHSYLRSHLKISSAQCGMPACRACF